MKLIPVDHDPFADTPTSSGGVRLVPVDHDPFAEGASHDLGTTAATVRGVIDGIPVAGPYLTAGVERAAAGLRSLKNDTRFSDELAHVRDLGQQTARAHPWATTGGEIAGGIAGTIPLVAAAPAAFGAGAGGLKARTLASTASGALLGGTDAAVRSDGSADAAQDGTVIGGALGAAGPVAGRLIGKAVTAIRGEALGMGLMREMAHGMSEKDLGAAQALRDTGESLPGGGARLSVGEALNGATGGRAARASQLERVAANSGGEGGRIAAEFYAARPASVDNVARAAFEGIAPQNLGPSGLGLDLQGAARSGIEQTPEGIALAQARADVGPRVTPDAAGQVIQREMRGVADARQATRDAAAARDYEAARASPETIGIERTVTVERPGEPIVTQAAYSHPQFQPGAPAPLAPAPAAAPAAAEVGSGRAQSLLDYLARNGGIPLDAETRAADLNRAYRPGAGTLARNNAPTWDDIRVRLAEEGFLPPDAQGYARAEGVRDFVLDALHQERIGRGRTVRQGQEATVPQRRGAEADEFADAVGRAEGQFDDSLRGAGVDPASVHPDIRSRALRAMMDDPRLDATDAYERVVGAMRENPAPFVKGTTVTEEISAPRFGQVDPQAALDALDRQVRTAKGDVRASLETIRRDLYEHGVDPVSGVRETDLSVEGLLHARERIDQHIDAALGANPADRTKARDLTIVRRSLDEQLKTVPEVATADANFAANSRPLEPFASDAPLGRVTARDDLTGRMRTPSEQVPGMLQGASAAREFLANATPAARQAYEGRVATQILDAASDARGAVDADKLHGLLRDNADVLGQMPEVYHRLEAVVRTRDALARVEASPLGRIAAQPDVDRAIRAVFATNPKPGSQGEVSAAMEALVRNRPSAARDLARIYLEGVFNEATQQRNGIAAQYGGAGFASAVRGNGQQRHNLEVVLRALPEGETILRGMDRMLTTLEATGYRPQKGSDTAFNEAIKKQFANGSTPIGQAVSDVATGAVAGASMGGVGGALGGAAVGLKRSVNDAMLQARMMGSGEAIARLMFDPRALPDLRVLARAPAGSKNAELFTQRLLRLANGGAAPLRERDAD